MALNIAFAGGNCSGKTTLAQWLAQELNYPESLQYFNQTRKLIISKYNGQLNQARADNINFQTQLLNDKVYWETKHRQKGFITDRTTLDNLAYFIGFGHNMCADIVLPYQEKALRHAILTYNTIICLTPLFLSKNHELSPPDTAIQLRIYYIVKALCSQVSSNCKIVYIDQHDLLQRKTSLKRVLK